MYLSATDIAVAGTDIGTPRAVLLVDAALFALLCRGNSLSTDSSSLARDVLDLGAARADFVDAGGCTFAFDGLKRLLRHVSLLWTAPASSLARFFVALGLLPWYV